MSQPHRPLFPPWIPWIVIAAGSAAVGEAMGGDATGACVVTIIVVEVVAKMGFAVADDSWPQEGGGSPPPSSAAVVGVVMGGLVPRRGHRVHRVPLPVLLIGLLVLFVAPPLRSRRQRIE